MASKGKTAKSTASKDAAKQRREKLKPKRRGRGMRTYADQLKIEERQCLVVDLVKAGKTFRQISTYLKSKGFNASVGIVHKDLVDTLVRNRETVDVSVRDWLDIELGTLQELQATFYLEAKQHKDTEAAGIVLRILRERDRYLGISKAMQSQAAAADQLAKFLGMEPEELPNGDGDAAI